MKAIHCTSAVGSLINDTFCPRPYICYVVGVVSKYQSSPKPEHWTTMEYIFKDMRRTNNYMLTYGSSEVIPIGYTDSDLMSDMNSRKSTIHKS